MKSTVENNVLTVALTGQITSGNAEDIRKQIEGIVSKGTYDNLILDANDLEYISSAGLRIVFTFKKLFPQLKIVNVSLDVYDIFNMTGFTKIIDIRRKLATLSVEGLKVIGEGRTGIVYRIDKDTIVKVYKRHVTEEFVEKELSMCREAFVLGIPTAITFDIVRVGDSLASRFELLDCDTLSQVIADNPDKLDYYLDEYANLLLRINSISSDELELPDKKQKWLEHVDLCLPHLDEAHGKKLAKLINEIPEASTFIHGDCHTKNIMSDGKSLFLIDLGALSKGYPIFELASLFRGFYCFDFVDPGNAEAFLELPRKALDAIYKGIMERYFEKYDQSVENKIEVVGLTYFVSWSLRYENNPKRVEDAANRLADAIDLVDDLILPLKKTA